VPSPPQRRTFVCLGTTQRACATLENGSCCITAKSSFKCIQIVRCSTCAGSRRHVRCTLVPPVRRHRLKSVRRPDARTAEFRAACCTREDSRHLLHRRTRDTDAQLPRMLRSLHGKRLLSVAGQLTTINSAIAQRRKT
jgi:hypothetical protein